MKIKILILFALLFNSCNNDNIDQPQIQFSKDTAISKAVQKASPGVVGI